MNSISTRLFALAALIAALGAVSGCSNFPANKPSALPPPHHGKAEAP